MKSLFLIFDLTKHNISSFRSPTTGRNPPEEVALHVLVVERHTFTLIVVRALLPTFRQTGNYVTLSDFGPEDFVSDVTFQDVMCHFLARYTL